MKKNRASVLAGIATIFIFTLTGCQNTQSGQKPAAPRKITVTYTLVDKVKKDAIMKTVKVPQKTTVLTGLKKAWKVDSTKGFITAIDNRKQDAKKKIYWTYTINGKFASKSANQQKLAKNDEVKFTLAKMK
ncbi:DUF4430 domain-containing protein [Lactobacillus sp. XV13L]|nr:DUF4430 domain-containing protein [Lactobacillus sp. XV13L]